MPNPIEQIVALAKKGDRRVLLGGAAVIGGGVGLIVYVRSRSTGGASGLPTLAPSAATSEFGDGGGGGAGGGADISSLLDEGQAGAGLNLPVLDNLGAPSELTQSTLPSNLAGSEPITLPELPTLTASPYFGSLPTLPAFEQPQSYTGAAYGSPPGETPVLQSALSTLRSAPAQTQPVQTAISREIKAEPYTAPKVSSQPVSREIAAEPYVAPARETATEAQARVAREVQDFYNKQILVVQEATARVQQQARETYAEQAAAAARAIAAPRSNLMTFAQAAQITPARQAYVPPTAQTARAEVYTAPARTAVADVRTAPRREIAEPSAAARSTLIVKPKNRLDTLR